VLAALAAQTAPAPPAPSPQPSGTSCDRSVYYILRGQYGAALKQLDGARSAGKSEADVENLRGLALLLSGDLPGALVKFEHALALTPALREARFNRAVTLLRLGAHAKASAEFAQLYADDTFSLRASAAYHNGLALDALKRPAEAEEWLSRALALDRSFDSALLYIGTLRERRGDLQGAGRAYLDYLAIHPGSPVAALRFGISAHRAGRPEAAKKYLQQVIAADPTSNEAAEARKYLVMWE
jgi:tetratricopeptide (TPR) repeat protein